MSRANRKKSIINAKNVAVLCTWHFQPTLRAAPRPLGGCVRQNLVPRPKAPQGSWVASRGCCGALAVRQPLHPCREGFPEHAWDKDEGLSGGRSGTRNAALAAAAAGAVEESAGAGSPRPSSRRGRGLSPQQRGQRVVPSTSTEVLPPPRRLPPPHQEASPADMGRGSRGRGGVLV